jgi:hypothetical protein
MNQRGSLEIMQTKKLLKALFDLFVTFNMCRLYVFSLR